MTNQISSEPETSPKKWWQWVLFYPTFGIAVLGSFPTFNELYNSSQIEVPFGQSTIATEQNKLWQTNYDCSQNKFNSVKNANNIEVGAIVCSSGDILLKVTRPNSKPKFRWVGLESLRIGLLDILVKPAFADNLTSDPQFLLVKNEASKLVCQKWIKKGVLLRRVSQSNGVCYDEVLNTYTGTILSKNEVECNPEC